MTRPLGMLFVGVLVSMTATTAQAQDLTGTWTSNGGSKIYIRQMGSEIYLYTEDAPVNPRGSTVAFGSVRGNELHLKWADVSKGGNRNAGIMIWTVESDKKIVIKEKTGGYGENSAARD